MPASDGPGTTTRVNTALPTGTDGFVQETVPCAPTAGVVQDQPGALESETKVVPAGSRVGPGGAGRRLRSVVRDA